MSILNSANRLKLAVFGINVSHGCTISSAPGGIEVNWPESVRLAQAADRIGIEALIPVGRWKGFGGPSEFNHRCFETYTWAAGIAQATQRIQVFATSHIPTIHPVLAAKQATTIDHISNGRFGLNIVAGWNHHELAMFGQRQLEHDQRYGLADEWLTLIKRLWRESGVFDFSGEFYACPQAYAEPKPLQSPYPVLMSAGVSSAGRRFAAKHTDINFILAPTLEHAREIAADIKTTAREEFKREVQVWGNAAIFCRKQASEAQAYFEDVIYTQGDREAAGNLLDTFTAESQSQSPAHREEHVLNMMAGYSGFPVVGTPAQVAHFIAEMSAAGLDGITLSWPNYDEGILQFEQELLPLLRARGLRQ